MCELAPYREVASTHSIERKPPPFLTGVVEHNICFFIHYIHTYTYTYCSRTPDAAGPKIGDSDFGGRCTTDTVMVISSNLNYGIKGSTLVAVTCQLSVPHRDTPHVTRTGLRHPRDTAHTRRHESSRGSPSVLHALRPGCYLKCPDRGVVAPGILC